VSLDDGESWRPAEIKCYETPNSYGAAPGGFLRPAGRLDLMRWDCERECADPPLPLPAPARLPPGKYWCWVHWTLEVTTFDFTGCKEVLLRAWDNRCTFGNGLDPA
jgi:hypothetical protein